MNLYFYQLSFRKLAVGEKWYLFYAEKVHQAGGEILERSAVYKTLSSDLIEAELGELK